MCSSDLLISSIDDFGTGYSSLNLLQDINFKVLKLDKSFLENKKNNVRNQAIVAHIVKMAKELDMEVIAEGVETMDELFYMKRLSCEIVQGYLFDKPLPKFDFEKRLIIKNY